MEAGPTALGANGSMRRRPASISARIASRVRTAMGPRMITTGVRHPFFELPTPIVIGHRGSSGEAPENTLPAFARALEQGTAVLETDVHATADGVVVVYHDEYVDRTTDGSGAIAELTAEALRRLATSSVPTEVRASPFEAAGCTSPPSPRPSKPFRRRASTSRSSATARPSSRAPSRRWPQRGARSAPCSRPAATPRWPACGAGSRRPASPRPSEPARETSSPS